MPAPAGKFSQMQNFQPNPDQTPEEIAERCAEIQKEWTPYERWRRSGGRRMHPAEWERLGDTRQFRIAEVFED